MCNNQDYFVNDNFYFKKESPNVRCKFAFLHLDDESGKTFLLIFKDTDTIDPECHIWDKNERDNKVIREFLEEVVSYQDSKNIGEETSETLWHIPHAVNSIIPVSWVDEIIPNYKAKILTSQNQVDDMSKMKTKNRLIIKRK